LRKKDSQGIIPWRKVLISSVRGIGILFQKRFVVNPDAVCGSGVGLLVNRVLHYSVGNRSVATFALVLKKGDLILISFQLLENFLNLLRLVIVALSKVIE
jgi:hypothetical protein